MPPLTEADLSQTNRMEISPKWRRRAIAILVIAAALDTWALLSAFGFLHWGE